VLFTLHADTHGGPGGAVGNPQDRETVYTFLVDASDCSNYSVIEDDVLADGDRLVGVESHAIFPTRVASR